MEGCASRQRLKSISTPNLFHVIAASVVLGVAYIPSVIELDELDF